MTHNIFSRGSHICVGTVVGQEHNIDVEVTDLSEILANLASIFDRCGDVRNPDLTRVRVPEYDDEGFVAAAGPRP